MAMYLEAWYGKLASQHIDLPVVFNTALIVNKD